MNQRDIQAFDNGFVDGQKDMANKKEPIQDSENYNEAYLLGYHIGQSGKYTLSEPRSLNEKLKVIYNKAIKIVEDNDISWENTYDLIFSAEVSQAVFTLIKLEWYDPDTSYKEDVEAFMSAFKKECQDLGIID